MILTSVFNSDARDVDLYVGILSEKHLEDGMLGPVGSCIIADQFVRSKIGDRFWYETNDSNLRFTPGDYLFLYFLLIHNLVGRFSTFD